MLFDGVVAIGFCSSDDLNGDSGRWEVLPNCEDTKYNFSIIGINGEDVLFIYFDGIKQGTRTYVSELEIIEVESRGIDHALRMLARNNYTPATNKSQSHKSVGGDSGFIEGMAIGAFLF